MAVDAVGKINVQEVRFQSRICWRLRSEVGRGTSLVFRLPKAARRTTTEIGRGRASRSALEERDRGVRDSIRSSLAEPAGLVDDSGGVARRGGAP